MENFKEETKTTITESGHTTDDVMFIGSSDGKYRLNWKEFEKISDFTYHTGFGAQEIAKDLIIYFNDKTYIDRGEYDGSEWWEYNVPLVYSPEDESKTYIRLSAKDVGRTGWETLEYINEQPHGY